MLGAMIGDIVGSTFEFNNHRSKVFRFFRFDCAFTDDSVMTTAVARALLMGHAADDARFREDLIDVMHEYGERYPDCGFGGMFGRWLISGSREPYNSFGNGSAMRVSPVAWVAKSLGECEHLAALTASVTHNHEEGIRGAVCTAGAAYLARTTHDMEAVRAYVARHYTIDFTLDEIRDTYRFNETCQKTVPQAMQAFFESTGFEDAIRNAISVGGDSDTLAAITGAVAEAYYGIDKGMREAALCFLDDFLKETVSEFTENHMR